MRSGIKWKFETRNFRVELYIEREYGYKYEGDDEYGELQGKLDSGEYVVFTSEVKVILNGETVGADYLGGSVYADDKVSEFWTAHRDPDPRFRNCSLNNQNIGHYFPDMVRGAIKEARATIAKYPKLRA